jgi:hypothetical protein
MRWRRYKDYSFASGHMLVPLAAAELPKAAVGFPIVFARGESGYMPFALVGVKAGANLFVGPRGEWLGRYIPASLRSQPFVLGRDQAGRFVLCVDAHSPLINDSEGERFFDQNGEPSEACRQVMEFMQVIEQGRAAAHVACEALARHNCFAPLAVPVKIPGSPDQRFEGLFQVNEAALAALPDEAFLELRKTGGLLLAYAHLLSLQNMAALGQLAARRAQEEAKQAAAGAAMPDLSLLDKNGTFGFDALR